MKAKKTVIRQWLEERGITQGELAHDLGITPNFLNNLINRKHRNIKIALLRRISSVTKIPMPKLVDDLLQDWKPHEDAA